MIDISDFALYLAVGAISSLVMSLFYPTRSMARQRLLLAGCAVVAAGATLYLAEKFGITTIFDPLFRDYIIVAVLSIVGIGVMALTFDLNANFDTLKDDPAYAMFGRSGLAISMLILSVFAMTSITVAWYQIDPTVFEARGNIAFLYSAGAGGSLRLGDFFIFALDQSQKALLFDISEVYRVGLIDIGNNPEHYAFSTACLVYRTFLSVFVIAIVVRLVR